MFFFTMRAATGSMGRSSLTGLKPLQQEGVLIPAKLTSRKT